METQYIIETIEANSCSHDRDLDTGVSYLDHHRGCMNKTVTDTFIFPLSSYSLMLNCTCDATTYLQGITQLGTLSDKHSFDNRGDSNILYAATVLLAHIILRS